MAGIPQPVAFQASRPKVGRTLFLPFAAILGGFAVLAASQSVPAEFSQVGQWSAVNNWPIVAVHAVLLETGKVLVWSDGSAVQLWDPATGVLTRAPNAPSDISNAGHVTQADGVPMIIGGRSLPALSIGLPDVNLFNPATETWASTPVMNRLRWRPTGTVLPDGRVLASGGADTCSTCDVPISEVHDGSMLTWSLLEGVNATLSKYPFMFVIPDGRVLRAGSVESPTTTEALDVDTGTWTSIDSRVLDGGSAVMYTPGRVMKSGTASRAGMNGAAARTTYVLDMNQATPAWQQAGLMSYPRAFHNLTLLPDGSVAATGGATAKGGGSSSQAVLPAEIWSPATQQWTTMASMQKPRLYQSVGLLLPDGRVLVAGSGAEPGVPDQQNAEIFSPPYLFKGARPRITAAPSTLSYANQALVTTPDGATISAVAMVRTGAVTHSFNQDQRFVPLAFGRVAGGISITAPENPNLAPPGNYLLFILNGNGVPSTGSFIRLGSAEAATQSAALGGDAPLAEGAQILAAAAAAAPPAIDRVAWGDQPSTSATTVTTSTFSTAAGNELLLAFISAGSTSSLGTNTTVTSVTGAGLTWQLVVRTNAQRGTAEIWRAFAPAPLSNATVTARTSRSAASSISVVSFSSVDTSGTNGSGAIGAIKSASAASGAPTGTLTTTRDNAWVFGVGSDRDAAIGRTLGPNQTLVHQYLPSAANDTYWVQRASNPTTAGGTSVTINDTAPTGNRYNLSLCEIVPPDITPPTVTTVTPASGAINVAKTSPVTATFSETMTAATITNASVELRDPGNAPVAATVTYAAATRTATLTPVVALANATTYTATVKSGASGAKDAAGNGIASDFTWAFTTVGDMTPPTVTGVSPTSGATNVVVTTAATATFSEPMAASTITAATILLRGPGNTPVPATVTYNAATLTTTIAPSVALAFMTTYTATVAGGAGGVQDVAGNALANDYTWTFTTGNETTPPTVTGMAPVNGATNISTTATMTTTFSEAMAAATVNSTTISLSSGSDPVSATVTYDIAARTATLTPTSPLANSTTYTATVTGGAAGTTDLAGNALANNVTWSFTTQTDTTSPAAAITLPPESGIVSGTVSVWVDASDDVAVAGAQLMLDGAGRGFGTSSVLWDQVAPDPVTAGNYFYEQYLDGASSPAPLTGVICSAGPNASTQSCAVDVAAFVPTHSVKITAWNGLWKSSQSQSLLLKSIPYAVDWNTTRETNGSHQLTAIVRDAAGNVGLAAPVTVIIDNEKTPPTVVAVTPANGTPNLPRTASVTATFSEAMSDETITATTLLLRDSSNATIAATVVYSATTLTATLTPTAPLAYSTTYVATVKGPGDVRDASWNELASDVTWSFTTEPDTTPPTVTGLAPPNGATSISSTTTVTATFSEAMATGTITTSTLLLLAPGNLPIPATVAYSPATRTASLTPTAVLGSLTTYTAKVKGGANGATDLAGNALATDVAWAFTTLADTTPPTVTSVTPIGGATNVAATTAVTAIFSEAMTAATISTVTMLLRDPVGTTLPAAVTYTAATRTATLTPTAALANSTTYTARVKSGVSGVKDAAGNALVSDYVWTFTTGADTAPPAITGVAPAGGTSGAPTTSAVTAIFSEAMTSSTITAATVVLHDPSSTTVPATITYSTATLTATLTPTAALAYSTTYTVTVKSGTSGVKDVAGNALVSDYVWSFTTAADTTTPTVTNVTPAAGATSVPPATAITATFSEAMTAATITTATFVLRDPTAVTVPATVSYAAATRVATLTPTGALTNSSTYTALVLSGAGGMMDASGNPLATDYSWTFTTAAETTPPTVTSATPLSGATGVAPTAPVTATFSEAMTTTTITTATVMLRDPAAATVPATVTYDPVTRTATLTPAAPLAYSAVYTTTVKGGATGVKDAAGNALVSDYVWSFTTGADTTPPTVTNVTPVDGAAAIPTSSSVTVIFSEAMTASTLTTATVLLRDPAATTVPATLGYVAATRTATLTPIAALAPSTLYTATILSGPSGVKDSASNALVSDYVWAFTTAADTMPPTVTGVTPANGATSAAPSTTVTATFSETMTAATITTATFLLRDPIAAIVPATAVYTAATRTATLTPAAALTNSTTYAATVMGGANGVMDASGNQLAADYSWTFTTGADTTPPTVTSVTPLSGATGVAATSPVTVTFSEAMTATTITAATVLLRDPTAATVPAAVTYNPVARVATLTPTAALAYSTVYTATAKSGTTGVKDAAGNTLATDRVWNFTTSADTTPPTVTGVTPVSGATAIATTSTVTATFNEPMLASTLTTATVLLRDPAATAVPATVTYAAATRTVTLTPTAALTSSTTYTATLKSGATGMKDAAGNALAIDYVWLFTTAADTTPPTVTSVTPAGAATGVATTTKVTAVFSEAMAAATISATTILLKSPTNTPIAATVTYAAATRTATLTPAAPLALSTTYTATVKSGPSGVSDAAGNAMLTDHNWSFTTTACPCSLWTTTTAVGAMDSDTAAVEVGMKFKSDVSGFVTGVRFYKYSANTGTHIGHLWTATGTLLGTVTFTGETASGWQQATFAAPIAITANTTYIVSYHMNAGRYATSNSGFASAVDKPPLHAIANGTSANGVYVYGANSAFPNQTWNATNYWVDVIFTP